MHIDIDFFKRIYSDDIIYHYTKASTAIDFILFNGQLRFNARKNSNDPIESRKARRSTIYEGKRLDNIISEQTSLYANYLLKYISEFENQFHQICFCKNNSGKNFSSEYYIGSFNGKEELFGFTKLRMWDQYADNYSGVCIAFSKEKILSKNEPKIDLLKDDIKYLTFQQLSTAKIVNFQGNYMSQFEMDEYKKMITEKVKQSFFYKHKDYSSENEFRIGTLYDKNNCCIEEIKGEVVYNKTIMLDISDCIEAIFLSSYANNKQKSELLDYANKFNIPIIEMVWKYNSFEARDYKRWNQLVEDVRLRHFNKED